MLTLKELLLFLILSSLVFSCKTSTKNQDNKFNEESYEKIVFNDDMDNLYNSLDSVITSDKARELYVVATNYFKAKNINKAIEYMQMAHDLEPNNLTINKDLGIIFQHNYQMDSSKCYFDKCLKIDSTYSMALNAYGLLLVYEDNAEYAIDYFRKALKYSKGFQEYIYYYNIALAYNQINYTDSACYYLNKSESKCPEDYLSMIEESREDYGCSIK